LKLSLNHALTPARANRLAVGSLAQQQSQCADQDGLAGAGLARDHVESGFEFDSGILDHGQIFNSERLQHG